MPIALTCPSCDHNFKVKDELAGRKIKCPECGQSISVAEEIEEKAKATMKSHKAPVREDVDDEEEETATSSAKSRKAQRDPDDDDDDVRSSRKSRQGSRRRNDDDEEDRPRKKKKKKKAKSNTGLIVGISVGAVALIAAIILVIVFAGGKGKDNTGRGSAGDGASTNNAPRERDGATSNRIKSDIESVNNLKQLGLAYMNRLDAGKGPPSGLGDLGDYLGQEKSRLATFFSGSRFTITWGVSLEKLQANPNQLLAYEAQPGPDGKHMVLRGYLAVELLDESEFQAAQKGKMK